MKNIKTKNEQIKRKYFRWLKEAQGFSASSIDVIEKSIWDYEAFSKEEDYALFDKKRAIGFKKWLSEKKNNDKLLELSTQHTRLTKLIKFFKWLADQSGYKSKISVYDIAYLKMDKKSARIAIAPKVDSLDYPSIEQVIHVCSSINPKSEIDMRDKALIAFTLLSGMRDEAILTLPLGCFNPDKLLVSQDPSKGVKTKFSKSITTFLFEFDDELLKVILYWYNYLLNEKKFDLKDPFFPRTKVEQTSDTNYAFQVKGVEPYYWNEAQSMRDIFKLRCENAGIDYYSPHKFRHTSIRYAMDKCKNVEQMKAVSQNVGHEKLATTLVTYGRLASEEVGRTIKKINFKGNEPDDGEKLNQILSLLQK